MLHAAKLHRYQSDGAWRHFPVEDCFDVSESVSPQRVTAKSGEPAEQISAIAAENYPAAESSEDHTRTSNHETFQQNPP